MSVILALSKRICSVQGAECIPCVALRLGPSGRYLFDINRDISHKHLFVISVSLARYSSSQHIAALSPPTASAVSYINGMEVWDCYLRSFAGNLLRFIVHAILLRAL